MNTQIGQYQILCELGAGGMGVVYRALDVELQREVALKRLRSEFAASAAVLERFRREAQLQGRLNHPNIAQLYCLAQTPDAFCIVMEYIEGTALKSLVPLAWREAVPISLQALDGLGYAHSMGVLHRDIKPENILIDRRGTVKVMDFGIAHAVGAQRLTREKALIGTIEYMAPERIQGGQIDNRGDIYSMGVLLFELLTGRLPYNSTSEYEIMKWHVEGALPPLSQFGHAPAELDQIVHKAAAKKPEDRYASCEAMAEALRVFCAATGLDSKLVSVATPKAPMAAAGGAEVPPWNFRLSPPTRVLGAGFVDGLSPKALPREPLAGTENPGIDSVTDNRPPSEHGISAKTKTEKGRVNQSADKSAARYTLHFANLTGLFDKARTSPNFGRFLIGAAVVAGLPFLVALGMKNSASNRENGAFHRAIEDEKNNKLPEAMDEYKQIAAGHGQLADQAMKEYTRLSALQEEKSRKQDGVRTNTGNDQTANLLTEMAKPRGDMPKAALNKKNDVAKDPKAARREGQGNTKKTAPKTSETAAQNTPACELSASDIPVRLQRAETNRANGNYDSAEREYQSVLDCQPGNEMARDGLERARLAKKM